MACRAGSPRAATSSSNSRQEGALHSCCGRHLYWFRCACAQDFASSGRQAGPQSGGRPAPVQCARKPHSEDRTQPAEVPGRSMPAEGRAHHGGAVSQQQAAHAPVTLGGCQVQRPVAQVTLRVLYAGFHHAAAEPQTAGIGIPSNKARHGSSPPTRRGRRAPRRSPAPP